MESHMCWESIFSAVRRFCDDVLRATRGGALPAMLGVAATAFCSASHAAIPASERAVLQALYTSTNCQV
jgi:hypothetical protein